MLFGRNWKRTALLVGGTAVLLTGALRAGPDGKGKQPAADARPALDQRALAELELEHSRARDELLAAEARLALLAEKIFGSRLVVHYRGELDRPFRLAAVQMRLDGALAYFEEFERAPTVQALKLFDGYLPPGRHPVEVRVLARGPDDPGDGLPGYRAGSGMAVHLREGATTRVEFEAEQDGDAPGREDLRGDEPEGSWDVDIQASFTTERD